MDVEKIIRVLGYIIYTILWSPIIVIGIVVLPIIWVVTYIRAGRPIREAVEGCKNALIAGVQHDMNFIQTGKW